MLRQNAPSPEGLTPEDARRVLACLGQAPPERRSLGDLELAALATATAADTWQPGRPQSTHGDQQLR